MPSRDPNPRHANDGSTSLAPPLADGNVGEGGYERLDVREAVDAASGNIDFHGDVVLHCGTRSGVAIRAAGGVTALELIESARITCGGDLVAAGGFGGRARGHVDCGRDLRGKYLDNVEGEIRRNLAVDREVINCAFVVHGEIDMPTGTIIGGRTVVTGQVHLGVLGSAGAAVTELVIGSVPRLQPFHERLTAITDALEKRRETIDAQLKQLAMLLGKTRATPIDKERQTELLFERSSLDTDIGRGAHALSSLTDRIAALRILDVIVERRLFPGVTIVSGNQCFQIREELAGPLRIGLGTTGTLAYFRHDKVVGPLTHVAELRAAA